MFWYGCNIKGHATSIMYLSISSPTRSSPGIHLHLPHPRGFDGRNLLYLRNPSYKVGLGETLTNLTLECQIFEQLGGVIETITHQCTIYQEELTVKLQWLFEFTVIIPIAFYKLQQTLIVQLQSLLVVAVHWNSTTIFEIILDNFDRVHDDQN